MSLQYTRYIALLYMKSEQIDYEKRHIIGLRDILFEKYLSCLDKIESWESGKIQVATSNKNHKKAHQRTMINLLENHKKEISEQLIDLDVKINSLGRTRDLYIELSEVY